MSHWGTAILFILLSSAVHASDMSPIEIYSKCYARLSDHPVDIDSADYKSVEAGTLDPVDACEKVLQKAKLGNSNGAKLLTDTKDDIALGVLRNFQQFHQTWFTGFSKIDGGVERQSYSYIDHSEPALNLTDALFGGEQFKTMFTRDDSIAGVRRGSNTTQYQIEGTRLDNLVTVAGPLKTLSPSAVPENLFQLSFERVEQGALVGIKPAPKLMVPYHHGYITGRYLASQANTFRDVETEVNLNQHFGGGVFGSTPYILFNSESPSRLDGGVRVHRRLANNTFSDLLCLTLPTLNNSDDDLADYMKTFKDSDLSFRQDRSCAQCHATLDPFAHSLRNIAFANTSTTTFLSQLRAAGHPGLNRVSFLRFLKKFNERISDSTITDSNNTYHRQKPRGRIYYRDYNGQKIDIEVIGPIELGKQMAKLDDPYICAAQRYYGFLTGVNINVSANSGDEFYTKHREKIIELGKSLKTHQSLKTLVLDILKSEAFQTRNPNLANSEGV